MDWQRASRIFSFFIKLFCHLIWWDIILNLPILRWFRTPPLPRWQQIARDYSALATSLGGMLVKLGQFMSIRVDLLPVGEASGRDCARHRGDAGEGGLCRCPWLRTPVPPVRSITAW